jgi:hypothetical protein
MPKVHLSFGLDTSGVVSLVKAEATLDLAPAVVPVVPAVAEEEQQEEAAAAAAAAGSTEGSVADSENATATATAAPASDASEGATAAKDTNATATSASTDEATSNTSAPKKKATEKKSAASKGKENEKVLRKVLKIDVDYGATVPRRWTPAQIAEARHKRYALKEADDLLKATEAALNELEAYIYRVKNMLSDQEEQLKEVSTEEQRQAVIDMANEAEVIWL